MKKLLFDYGNLPNALNKQEIYELFIRMKNGDSLAKEKIVLHNLKLVIVILKKYYKCGASLEDLISVGNIGLMKAINTFDISKKNEFSTYASVCINNEMLMYLRKEKNKSMVVSMDNLVKCLNNDNDITYESSIHSDEDIILEYEEKNVYQVILNIISYLPENERTCIMLFFGLNGYEKVGQKDIASVLNITQPQVSKLVKRAIGKIRVELIKVGILEEKNIIKERKSLVKSA